MQFFNLSLKIIVSILCGNKITGGDTKVGSFLYFVKNFAQKYLVLFATLQGWRNH